MTIAKQHAFDVFAHRFVEPADHAEVQQADRTIGQQNQISRVGIGVVEAVVEDHFEIHLGAVPGHLGQIELRLAAEARVGESPAIEPFHRKHALGRELVVAVWDADVAVAAEVARELVEVAGLAGEVELAADHAAKFRDHRLRAIRGQLGEHLGELRQSGQDVEIDFHSPLDAGVLDLHHHVGAAGRTRAMHLADRRGSERHCVEIDEHRVERCVELRLDRRADRFGVICGNVGLQLLQFVRQRQADLVRPRAKNLAELDERGAELFDCQANAGLATQVSERLAVAVFEDALHHRQVEATDPAGQAILAQDRENLAPAIGVAIHLRDGGDLHSACGRLAADRLQGLRSKAGEPGVT